MIEKWKDMMNLKIKIYDGRLIKRGDSGYKSVLAWYNSGELEGDLEIEAESNANDDTAYKLVMEHFGAIAVVQSYLGVIEGFRFISYRNMEDIKHFIDGEYSSGVPGADKSEIFDVLSYVYANAELIENEIQLRYKQWE